MPTYQYRCPSCGQEFEKFEKMSAKTRSKCPKCGTRAERLISGGVGLVFKGSGFYITDYKRSSGGDKPTETGSDKPEKSQPEKSQPKKPPKSPGAE